MKKLPDNPGTIVIFRVYKKIYQKLRMGGKKYNTYNARFIRTYVVRIIRTELYHMSTMKVSEKRVTVSLRNPYGIKNLIFLTTKFLEVLSC